MQGTTIYLMPSSPNCVVFDRKKAVFTQGSNFHFFLPYGIISSSYACIYSGILHLQGSYIAQLHTYKYNNI
jgi:hypothetical protein